MDFVNGYSLVPEPPASMIPFMDFAFLLYLYFSNSILRNEKSWYLLVRFGL